MTDEDKKALREKAEKATVPWWLDNKFISAANPKTVLALLDEIDRLRGPHGDNSLGTWRARAEKAEATLSRYRLRFGPLDSGKGVG